MSSNTNTEPSFGRMRSLLWPIHKNEARRFLPMFVMLFLLAFNQSAIRWGYDWGHACHSVIQGVDRSFF